MIPGFGEVAERLRRSTVHVSIPNEPGGGSGVIWNQGGLIVTNAHVARGAEATVELWDGRRLPARVIARDPRRDLARLQVTGGVDLPAAAPGDSDRLRPGELVVAVGNPLGFIGALTTGVVHALGPVRGLGGKPWVQAAVRLAPGNSGGPLANAAGEVIGINTMITSNGLALAVPSNAVTHFVASGRRAPVLGVSVRPVRLTRSERVGLMVLEVAPDSAAERASLMLGDILLAANGQALRSYGQLAQVMAESAGGSLRLQFLRGNRHRTRQVTVANVMATAEAA